jgi:hypothetical protein
MPRSPNPHQHQPGAPSSPLSPAALPRRDADLDVADLYAFRSPLSSLINNGLVLANLSTVKFQGCNQWPETRLRVRAEHESI